MTENHIDGTEFNPLRWTKVNKYRKRTGVYNFAAKIYPSGPLAISAGVAELLKADWVEVLINVQDNQMALIPAESEDENPDAYRVTGENNQTRIIHCSAAIRDSGLLAANKKTLGSWYKCTVHGNAVVIHMNIVRD
jgi:hypothetical protein